MPQTIADIMTRPPVTIGMDTTMGEVQAIFERHRFHHLVVRGDAGRCVGVISDRDLFQTLSPFVGKMSERTADANLLKRRAHQVMSRSLVTVRPSTLLRSAARVMLDRTISCVPVVDRENNCIGIVTIRDIVRWAIERMECDSDFIARDNDNDPNARWAA